MKKGIVTMSQLHECSKNVALPGLARTMSKPFDRLLTQKKPIPTLFCELVNRLGKWFSISKATLALHHKPTDSLRLSSWWDKYVFKEGVLISLPKKGSLFHQVINDNRPVYYQVASQFVGNHIERRILTSKDTIAVMAIPLAIDGEVYGVIGLSSPVPFAFDMIEEGYLNNVFEKLARTIAERGPRQYQFTMPELEIHDQISKETESDNIGKSVVTGKARRKLVAAKKRKAKRRNQIKTSYTEFANCGTDQKKQMA